MAWACSWLGLDQICFVRTHMAVEASHADECETVCMNDGTLLSMRDSLQAYVQLACACGRCGRVGAHAHSPLFLCSLDGS